MQRTACTSRSITEELKVVWVRLSRWSWVLLICAEILQPLRSWKSHFLGVFAMGHIAFLPQGPILDEAVCFTLADVVA